LCSALQKTEERQAEESEESETESESLSEEKFFFPFAAECETFLSLAEFASVSLPPCQPHFDQNLRCITKLLLAFLAHACFHTRSGLRWKLLLHTPLSTPQRHFPPANIQVATSLASVHKN